MVSSSLGATPPAEIDDKRLKRLGTSLKKKSPKLHLCKAEGAITVLILENQDFALSNHVLIGDAVCCLIADLIDRPDEIYLVDTSIETWTVHRLTHGDSCWPEGEKYHDFDSKELEDATSNSLSVPTYRS